MLIKITWDTGVQLHRCLHLHENCISRTRKLWIVFGLPIERIKAQVQTCIRACQYHWHLLCAHPQARQKLGFVPDKAKFLSIIEESNFTREEKDYFRQKLQILYRYSVSLDRFRANFANKKILPRSLVSGIREIDDIFKALSSIIHIDDFNHKIGEVQDILFGYAETLIDEFNLRNSSN